MGKTSTAAKSRWNKANMVQVNCRVRPELAERLRAYLARHNLSLPGFLAEALEILEGKEKEENENEV